MEYKQLLDPLQGKIFWSQIWSTVLAALPVVVLFWLLVPRRWLAPKAGAAGALTAILVAILFYGMPAPMAISSFVYGAAFGLLPVGWTVFSAMLLYNITVETGRFSQIRQSISDLSGDARIQAMLIGFSFGAFLEGAAGGGTPVAICGAIMVGLGFHPFLAAVLCLIANTSPVAYGGLGTPLIVLGNVTGLDTFKLSIMAGKQLPWISFFVPLYMIKCMCSWKKTWEVWPALAVSGGSFAVFQYVFAHYESLYPMTDIGGGLFSLVVTALFLKFWKPKEEFRFETPPPEALGATPPVAHPSSDPHAAEAEALLGGAPAPTSRSETPLTGWQVLMAWMPFLIMSVLLMLTGIVRQKEKSLPQGKDEWIKPGPVAIYGDFTTNYQIQMPYIHLSVNRDEFFEEKKQESAIFNFPWLTAPGSAVMFSALISMVMLRMSRAQIGRVLHRTCVQMKIPIPTIAFMLGLSYVTRYAGMDATLGYAFVETGMLYPFFAAVIGWLGVFLTGTDAGSNALFGSLQKITATLLYKDGAITQLTELQAQHLICTANSTGGVMGKMIDAQSICVATAATHQLGKEADIFKAVVWHSIILASIVGILTMLQAYVYPFTLLVPK
jgi:lactate permease